MAIVLGILKFIFAFFAISFTLLFITSVIGSITNTNIGVDDKGDVVDLNRNARIWIGIITSIFWALLIAI